MAINMARLESEIRFCLERGINLEFTDDGTMVMVPDLLLPENKFNQSTTACLIVIPDNYGYGQPLSEFYLESTLRLHAGRPLPNHFSSMKEITQIAQRKFAFLGRVPRFSYFCIHPQGDLTIDEFLEQVFFRLCNM